MGRAAVGFVERREGMEGVEVDHIVDLSGDWWSSDEGCWCCCCCCCWFCSGLGFNVVGRGSFEESLGFCCWTSVSSSVSSSSVDASAFDGFCLRSVGGGISGSTKSVWR